LFRNVFWSAARNWGTRLGSVAVFFVLARILDAGQLGTFSAILAIMAVAELFAENGLGDAVIQSKSINERILSATLAINVGLAALLALILIASAGTLERAFDAPGLPPYLTVAIMSLLLNATSYVPQGFFRRAFAYRWLAMRALISTFISGTLAIGLAVAGFGVWSLVVQAVSFALLNAILVWWKRPFNPFARPDFAGAMPLVRFGLFLLGGRLLGYMSTRAIELVIAFRFGPAQLALYIIGTRVYYVAAQLITTVLVDVGYSTIADLKTRGENVEATVLNLLRMGTMVAVPLFMGMAATAQELCHVAFGAKGPAAAPFLTIVGFYGSLQMLVYLANTIVSASGRPKFETTVLAVQAAASVLILLPPWNFSATTLVLVNCAVAMVALPVATIWATRTANIPLLRYVKIAYPPYVAGLLMAAAIFAMRDHTLVGQIGSPFLRGSLLVALGASIYMAALILIAPKAARQAAGTLKMRLAARRAG
jgi:O-antigen/teichoic acid export membrane protein